METTMEGSERVWRLSRSSGQLVPNQHSNLLLPHKHKSPTRSRGLRGHAPSWVHTSPKRLLSRRDNRQDGSQLWSSRAFYIVCHLAFIVLLICSNFIPVNPWHFASFITKLLANIFIYLFLLSAFFAVVTGEIGISQTAKQVQFSKICFDIYLTVKASCSSNFGKNIL